MKYKWLAGGGYIADAQEVGDELEIVADKHNQKIHTADVVEYAEDKETALHDYFEWDNKKAAHEHRLTQAAHLIRHVIVMVEVGKTPDNKPIEVSIRKYETIREAESVNVYMDTLGLLSDKDLRIQILHRIRLKIEAAAKKMKEYNAIIEFFTEERQAVLFDMIDGMKDEELKMEKVEA